MGRWRAMVGAALVATGCAKAPEPPALAAILPDRPSVIAHRGFSGRAPENTMAAFDAAVELGVGFELDVTLSVDGHVVVMHDDTVDRTTDGTGAVADLTLAELEALDAGSWFDPAFAGEPVPTLAAVLDRHGGAVPIDIELKSMDAKEPLAHAVVDVIEQRGLVDEVFVTSFDPYMLEAVRERNPDIVRGQLTATFEDSDLNPIEKLFLRHMWLNGRSQPHLIGLEEVRASRGFLRRQHRKGRPVLVWTVNAPSQMRALLSMGVDGIITDHPDLLLELLGG